MVPFTPSALAPARAPVAAVGAGAGVVRGHARAIPAPGAMHHDGASAVNVNGHCADYFGVHTMSASNAIDRAIGQFLSTYEGDGAEAVSAIVVAAKRAAADKRGMQSALYAGFLTLAGMGAGGAVIRKAGANLRASITRVMRVNAGFPAVKPKGAKEDGAPDFSTASVYAGTVAGMLAARAENPNAWQAAVDAIDSGETPLPWHDAANLPLSVSAGKRMLAKYEELTGAELEHQFPALHVSVVSPDVPDVDILATALHSARREIDELRNLLAERDATIQAMRGEPVTERPAITA
jgi:hypothetical protein